MKGKMKKIIAGIATLAMAAQFAFVVPVSAETETLVNNVNYEEEGASALFKDYSRTAIAIVDGDTQNTSHYERIALTGTGGGGGAGYTFAKREDTENAVVTLKFDAKSQYRGRFSLRSTTPGTNNRNDDNTDRVFTLGNVGSDNVSLQPFGAINDAVSKNSWSHYEIVADCLNKTYTFKIYDYVDGKTDYSDATAKKESSSPVKFKDETVNYVTSFDFYGSNQNIDITQTSSISIDNLTITSEKPDLTIYTVTYDNDGAETTDSVASGGNVNAALIPDTTLKLGYNFTGWKVDNTSEIITTDALKSRAITADVKFTAQYEENTSYIEPIKSVTFTEFPANGILADSAEGTDNKIKVKVEGVRGTDLVANPNANTNPPTVTYAVKGLRWKIKSDGTGEATTDILDNLYLDGYGQLSENAADKSITLNVKTSAFNYYGAITATVHYNDEDYVVTKPIAYLGNKTKPATQILPRGGYVSDFNQYSSDMVGYVATDDGNVQKTSDISDVATDNWVAVGGNKTRPVTLKSTEEDGKFMRLESIEYPAGKTSSSFAATAIESVTDQQVMFDQKVRFNSNNASILLKSKAPTDWNAGATSFSLVFNGSKLTLNEAAEGINNVLLDGAEKNKWYRIVIASDVGAKKCYAIVYDGDTEAELGKTDVVAFSDSKSVTPVYYMFRSDATGTWVDFNDVKIYRATANAATVKGTVDDDTVSVPEAGKPASTTTVKVSGKTTEGYDLIGAATWSVEDEPDGVTVTPDESDSHIATLTVTDEASAGDITVKALIGGQTASIPVTLSSSQDSIKFNDPLVKSIEIPMTSGTTNSATYSAIVIDGDGQEIDGKTVTIELYDANNENPVTNMAGVSFSDGTLSVTSAAKPVTVTIRATSTNTAGETIKKAQKVSLHGLAFDFGADTEEDIADGYTAVGTTNTYTKQLGYGIEGTATAGGEGDLEDPDKDYLAGTFSFKVNVEPKKIYKVTTTYKGSLNVEKVADTGLTGGEDLTTNSALTKMIYEIYVNDDVLDMTFGDAQVASVVVEFADERKPGAQPNVFTIGDSTSASRNRDANKDEKPGQSWALRLTEQISKYPELTALATVTNDGAGSRNFVSYYNENKLNYVLTSVKPGDYVMIGCMGTNGTSSKNYEDLNFYIDACEAVGANVILYTYTPHGAKATWSRAYNSATQTFSGNRVTWPEAYDTDIIKAYDERKDEEQIVGLIEVGKMADDAFNAYVKAARDAITPNATSADTEAWAAGEAAAQEIIDCFPDHNHYYYGTLACDLMLNGYEGAADGIVKSLVKIIKGVPTLSVTAGNTTDFTIKVGDNAIADGAELEVGDVITIAAADSAKEIVSANAPFAVADGVATYTVKQGDKTITVSEVGVAAKPSADFAISFTGAAISGSTVTISANVTGTGTKKFDAYIAEYDGTALKAVKKQAITISDTTPTATVSFDTAPTGTVKAFVWDKTTSEPLLTNTAVTVADPT